MISGIFLLAINYPAPESFASEIFFLMFFNDKLLENMACFFKSYRVCI